MIISDQPATHQILAGVLLELTIARAGLQVITRQKLQLAEQIVDMEVLIIIANEADPVTTARRLLDRTVVQLSLIHI